MSAKRADELAKKITGAIMKIKNGESSPKETKIGAMFAELKNHDEAAYAELLAKYAPISKAYSEKQNSLLDDSTEALYSK